MTDIRIENKMIRIENKMIRDLPEQYSIIMGSTAQDTEDSVVDPSLLTRSFPYQHAYYQVGIEKRLNPRNCIYNIIISD